MTKDDFNNLQPGDIVRHEDSGESIIVTANYGGRVTAVRTYDITHPPEWKLMMKANHTQQSDREVKDCTREKDHDGPCNGWPCIICLYCRDTKGKHVDGICQDGSGRWFLPLHRNRNTSKTNPEWQQP